MDQLQIMDHVVRVLHERFDIDPASVTGATRQHDLGIDSILMVDLMLEIETALGFSFDIMDLPRNPSMDEICALIARHLAQRA
jgi:acyl carrier protein